jgi:hypothetical protein
MVYAGQMTNFDPTLLAAPAPKEWFAILCPAPSQEQDSCNRAEPDAKPLPACDFLQLGAQIYAHGQGHVKQILYLFQELRGGMSPGEMQLRKD